MVLSIGLDIGGTKVAAGVVNERGEVLAKTLRPTPTHSATAAEDAIVECVAELRAGHEAAAVGIGAAGWVDAEQAMVRFSPHLAWRNEPLKARLQERIDVPVIVDNDANAAAWAEFRFGSGRGSDVMVMVNLGTGIGGALVINGLLFRGAYGMAGEFGHMTVVTDGHWCPCGNRGCWEQYASGNALVRDARELMAQHSPFAMGLLERAQGNPKQLTGPQITEAALDGDQLATKLIADVGDWLGRGLADLAAALDPDVFVIGGGVSEAADLLLGPARTAFEKSLTGRGFRPTAQVKLATMRNDAGLIGAADLARHCIDEPPDATRAFWPRRRTSRNRRPW